MPGAPFLAHGLTFQFGSVMVGGIVSLTLPDESRGAVKVTHAGSAGDHRYVPGIREGGSVTIECRLIADDEGQDQLRANKNDNDGTIETCVVTLPSRAVTGSTVTYTFSGFCTAVGGDLPQDTDDAGKFMATVKVDGNVTKAVV